ncbi:3',5'-cyclic-nucleotide phosphodiesterase [Tulasnella sp. 331]|nr:3',5'-cyclic-nucleotide phosphodiesterase [Tulasnella sp. 331]
MSVSVASPNPALADSTPSAICFPSPSPDQLPPVMTPLERALGHLRRAKRELDELAADLSQIVLMAYTANDEFLSAPELHSTVVDQGGMGIITPPFTPASVVDTFASALAVPANAFTTSPAPANSTFTSLAHYSLPPNINSQMTPARSFHHAALGGATRPLLVPVSLQATPLASSSRRDKPLPPLPAPSPEPEPPLTPVTGTRSSFAKASLFGEPGSVTLERKNGGSWLATGGPSAPTSLSDRALSEVEEPQNALPTSYRTISPRETLARPPSRSRLDETPKPAFFSSPNHPPASFLFARPPQHTMPFDEQKSLPPLSPPSDPRSSDNLSSSSSKAPKHPPLVTSISMTVPPTSSTSILNPSTQPAYPDPIAEYYAGARRRSVDTGGLSLALKAGDEASDGMFNLGRGIHMTLGLSHVGAGWGWGGWEATDLADGPLYAELLCDMFVHTQNTTEVAPQDLPSVSSISPQRREQLIRNLSMWKFEPHHLTPDELLESAYMLFEALFKVDGMEEETGITPSQLRDFLHAVRKIYHEQNKYHNFQHAVDVFQAIYCFLVLAECVPPVTILLGGGNEDKSESPIPDLPSTRAGRSPSRSGAGVSSMLTPPTGTWSRTGRRNTLIQKVLENRDLLVVCFAAVGHDVAHPGLSNAFQKNARTPLSIVYDDKSALEQMHCQLLLNLMRKHGLSHLIDTAPLPRTKPRADSLDTGEPGLPPRLRTIKSSAPLRGRLEASPASAFRQLLVQTVLFTDMGLHFDWMNKLRALASEIEKSGIDAVSGRADVKQLICQALIKCGDISNPTRPHAVSEHWSKALLQEWSCQAVLEQELGLPVSVVASANEIVQAKGQVGFIDLFTKPLFDTTAAVIPSVRVIANQGDLNRALWQERLDGLTTAAGPEGVETSSIPLVVPAPAGLSELQDQHYRSVFPLSLPRSLLAPLPIPFPEDDGTPLRKWSQTSLASQDDDDDEGESNTPTHRKSEKAITHRGTRATSSVSSTSSATIPLSPFSPGAGGDSMSTGDSSPSSQAQSLAGDVAILTRLPSPGSQPEPPTTPMRAAYNASVRRKKSFHRQSWDIQSALRAKGEPVPPLPSQLGPDRSGK